MTVCTDFSTNEQTYLGHDNPVTRQNRERDLARIIWIPQGLGLCERLLDALGLSVGTAGHEIVVKRLVQGHILNATGIVGGHAAMAMQF